MALSERNRRALLLGGIGLGVLLLYFVAIEPLAAGYTSLAAEHQRLAERVAKIRYNQARDAWQASQVTDFEQRFCLLERPKPYDQQITTIGEQIVAAAQKSGAQLKGATPASPTPWALDPSLVTALVHLEAQAEWEKAFEFLGALYRIPGVLSLERLEMTGDPKKPGPITLRLAVSVLAAKPPQSQEAAAR